MKSPQRGFTLVELMIALVLGLLLLVALLSLLLATRRDARENDAQTAVQDQGEYALSVLSRDLMAAGYFGAIYDRSAIVIGATAAAVTPAPDCTADGWVFETSTLVDFADDADANIGALYPCLDADEVLAGTDLVGIHRSAIQPAAELAAATGTLILQAPHYYLQTNGISGTVIRTSSASYTPTAPIQPFTGPMAFYEWSPRLYFIRPWSRSDGDGQPALCRRSLDHANGALQTECLAEGIEDLQLQWGLDDDGDLAVDRYSFAPNDAELASARTVRLYLLARASEATSSYTDGKRYDLGDKIVSPGADGYFRRVFTTTVELRNR